MPLVSLYKQYKYQIICGITSQLRIIVILLFSGHSGLGYFSILFSTTSILSFPALFIQNNALQSRVMQNKRVDIGLYILYLVRFSFGLIILCSIISFVVFLNQRSSYLGINANGLVLPISILISPFFFLQSVAELSFTLKSDIRNYQSTLATTNIFFILVFSLLSLLKDIDSLHSIICAFVVSYILSPLVSIIRSNLKHYNYHVFRAASLDKFHSVQARSLFLIFRETFHFNIITLLSVTLDWLTKSFLESKSGLSAIGFLQIFQSIDSMIGSILAAPSYKKVLFEYSNRTLSYLKVLRSENYIVLKPVFASIIFLLSVRFFSNHFFLIPALEKYIYISIPLALFLFAKIPSLILGFIGQILIAFNHLNAVIILECSSRFSFSFFLIIYVFLFSFNPFSVPICALISSFFTLLSLYILSRCSYIPTIYRIINPI